MNPFHAQKNKEGGKQDWIAFDSPDDSPEDIPAAAGGYEEQLVAVDSPDDFEDEGEVKANHTV
jgi:hypothetical protein